MRFSTFIKSLPEQNDKNIDAFAKWAKRHKEFPLSSDPRLLALYLLDRLNDAQKLGFQLCMIIYSEQPNNQLPKDLKDKKAFTQAINLITGADFPRPTAPFQYICFLPIEMPTKEGLSYVFIQVDAFSRFLFMTGVENSNEEQHILKHLKLFTEHKDFKGTHNGNFSLVVHKKYPFEKSIQSIIKSVGGALLVNDSMVTYYVMPVVEDMFKSFRSAMS